MTELKIAVCQIKVGLHKENNLSKAKKAITSAAKKDSDLIVLPEMFNTPYDVTIFEKYAEDCNGETSRLLSELARLHSVYIVGGSIPEKEDGNIYNTSLVFDRQGNIIARHRKIHLFDIDIKNGINFKESNSITPGDRITVFGTEFCNIGLCICYDIRFPELFIKMSEQDVKIIIIPAAFNMTTGPAHWEILTRSRALDSQSYLVAAAPARNENLSYKSYGHSLVVDPWGKILAGAGFGEKIIYQKVNPGIADEIRNQLPVLRHKRRDVYR
jgi:omega-amidase